MIEYKTGDILAEDVEAIVNTVNCVGVMGRGIALQFKKAYPDNFKAYAAACDRKEVRPGAMFVWDSGRLTTHRYIINFPTKRHWRGKSRIEDIESGLDALAAVIKDKGIRSIAVPPLGSGLGGLEWSIVRSRIEDALNALADVRIIVFEPKGAPNHEKMVHNKSIPEMTPGRAALVALMNRYFEGLLDPFITLLELHKLMYFMQIAGQPLRLQFVKGHYGPYAENLRHVLHAIEGYMVAGYADGGDAPNKQLSLVPGVIDDASAFLRGSSDTRRRLDDVSDLIDGFESPFGLELLATSHWIVEHEEASTLDVVVEKFHTWNDHKQIFSSRQIRLAVDVLANKGWIKPLTPDTTNTHI
ncbi:type II toxin-antitoxin system antitoxin DNA ADP-ribosyl glycohydrolase DarG [Desulfarculus baarsii]